MKTGDGRPLAPFLRRDIERMLTRYELVSRQIAEGRGRKKEEALNDNTGHFPNAEKVQHSVCRSSGAVGETTATVLVAEVYHRTFETRRHVASFIGLSPSPYNSGDVDRTIKGISKALSNKLARGKRSSSWLGFWLRYQPDSKLSLWWRERFRLQRHAGPARSEIVALARKLAIALWRFVEDGIIPEGATAQGLIRDHGACCASGEAGWRPGRLMVVLGLVVVWAATACRFRAFANRE